MASVSRGGAILLDVQFYEYAGGPPYDPSDEAGLPELSILLAGELVAGPFAYNAGAGPIVRRGLGDFAYAWDVAPTATLGTYVARWRGNIHGSEVLGDEYFDVVAAGSATTGAGSPATLGEDFELEFLSGVEPVYIDPAEIMELFPDAGFVEVLEWIHFFSLEVDDLTNGVIPGTLELEYIRAATACALSRTYDWSGSGDAVSFRLGDFSVEGRNIPKSVINRGTASTWCELAAALREEVTGVGKAQMRGVIRGYNVMEPTPDRRLRHVEWTN